MPQPFSFSVPLDSQFRVLAPEVASKYAELLGGSQADADSVAAAVTAALDEFAAGSTPESVVDMKFRREADGIHIDLRSGSRTSTLKHMLAAAKR